MFKITTKDSANELPPIVACGSTAESAVYAWVCLYNAWQLSTCDAHSNATAHGYIESLLWGVDTFEQLTRYIVSTYPVGITLEINEI